MSGAVPGRHAPLPSSETASARREPVGRSSCAKAAFPAFGSIATPPTRVCVAKFLYLLAMRCKIAPCLERGKLDQSRWTPQVPEPRLGPLSDDTSRLYRGLAHLGSPSVSDQSFHSLLPAPWR
jgi:hypothetical protein